MDWQPLDTLPENTWALLYVTCPASRDGPKFMVDRFEWEDRIEREAMTPTKDGDHVIERTRVREYKERYWQEGGWAATHWMPLPEPPIEAPPK